MRTAGWIAAAAAALALPVSGMAQATGCPVAAPGDSVTRAPPRPPDVVLRASVSARSVRFAGAPHARLRAAGCAAWDTVIVTERVNLPEPVVPGITYRDVRVGVEVRSWLDLRCLLPRTPAPDSAAAPTSDPCAALLGDSTTAPRPR